MGWLKKGVNGLISLQSMITYFFNKMWKSWLASLVIKFQRIEAENGNGYTLRMA